VVSIHYALLVGTKYVDKHLRLWVSLVCRCTCGEGGGGGKAVVEASFHVICGYV
jgi:hypothetical protein